MIRVLLHQLPEFYEELAYVFDLWNQAQDQLVFIGFRPKRNLEVRLLTMGSIYTYDGLELARQARRDAGLTGQDIAIVFTEKRLFEDEYYQLYFTGLGPVSVISLDFTKRFFGDYEHKDTVIFQAILINILTTISHKFGLRSHAETRICIMDFLNYMPDILKNIEIGPQYCDECTNAIESTGRNFLLSLAAVLRNVPNADSLSKNVAEKLFMDKDRLHGDESDFDYDIALSFAGEDRAIAEELALSLKKRGVKVFYDAFEKSRLWGQDLYVYLSDVYRLRADYCIMFLSENYARKLWTNHERRAAQERAFRENREYILPIRLDQTEIPGILDTVAYLDWYEEGCEEISRCVLEKLGRRQRMQA